MTGWARNFSLIAMLAALAAAPAAAASAGAGDAPCPAARTAARTKAKALFERVAVPGITDLADGTGSAALVDMNRDGRLDILVLNAAMLGTLTPVPMIDAAEFNRVLTLNILAQQALIASFDSLLRASENGRMIVLTSSVGERPRAYWGAYGASKAALENLALSYAEEVRNLSSLRVAIVDPGRTRTAMRAKAYPGEDPATLKEPSAVADRLFDLLSGGFETGHRLVID